MQSIYRIVFHLNKKLGYAKRINPLKPFATLLLRLDEQNIDRMLYLNFLLNVWGYEVNNDFE